MPQCVARGMLVGMLVAGAIPRDRSSAVIQAVSRATFHSVEIPRNPSQGGGLAMSIGLRIRFGWLVCTMAVCSSASAQITEDLSAAVEMNPIDGIIDAFRSYSVITISEGVGGFHGNEQVHGFLRTLIADRRFADVADDIVVEWGNSLYQDVIDRYTRGEEVPFSELRKVWQNTTQPHPVWDSPVYLEFFQAVRSRNETLPEEEHLRVLLGDPPMDWQTESIGVDLARFSLQRDAYPAELILDHVIERGRRALVVYGSAHLFRSGTEQSLNPVAETLVPNYAERLVARLERAGIAVFNTFPVSSDVAAEVQPDVAAWRPVRLTLIENTRLGGAAARRYFPLADTSPMQEQFDALIIFGPRSAMTYSRLSPELCAEDEYIDVRLRRMGPLGGDRQAFARQYC
jgi:hypothetical protein